MTLHVNTDRQFIRHGVHSTRYLRVSFQAPEAPAHRERLPLDLALVIDKSGSMSGGKLELAKLAARKCVDLLGHRDHVALVAYDTEVELLAPGALLDDSHRRQLHAAIDRLQPGSSTNLSGGWLTGCEEVGRAGRSDTVARTLLLSDGLANVGITSAEELAHHAGQLRRRGVATSTFGIGQGFDERLMEGMARSGGGNFYFIERPEQIADFLASELGEALEVVARDALLVVDADEGVEVESLDGRRVQRRGRRIEVGLDDLVGRQRLDLVLRVTFPKQARTGTSGVTVSLSDRDGVLQAAPVRTEWTYADHRTNDVQPRDKAVDRVVASRYAARAREEAAEHNRAGRLEEARDVVSRTAHRIGEYAEGDGDILRIVAELHQVAVRHERPLTILGLKGERALAYNVREAKDLLGRKMRNP